MGPARFNAAFTFAIISSESNLNASRGRRRSLKMERLPQDVAAGVARDVQLMNLRDRVRDREMTDATWWKGPIFDTWLRVAYYEKEFPRSTSQGGVHWEP